MFETLLKSELKKATTLANKLAGRTDSYVTAWYSRESRFENIIEVTCEISFWKYDTVAKFPLTVSVLLNDRRRSFAHSTSKDGRYIHNGNIGKWLGHYEDCMA